MKVRDILKTKKRSTITAGPRTAVVDAMKLLIDNKVSCLPVEDADGHLVGIISDKDIFHKIYQNPTGFGEVAVGDLMTTDLIVGLPDDEMSYIAGVMTNNRIRHVPIVDNDRIIGLISVGDVAKTQMENIKIENRYLKQYIDGTYPG
ncbi:MAG: CBS domain-containing protein [Candidatus Zixiibacteriota bacterium]|nr:MAG: CBS domain-containing protein [candidate division Zixibacteria bacterium]